MFEGQRENKCIPFFNYAINTEYHTVISSIAVNIYPVQINVTRIKLYKMLNKIKYAKRFRKIRREKPDYWYLPKINLGYIQIPKVASRSIRTAFMSFVSGQNVGDMNKEQQQEFSKKYSSHVAQKDIRNQTPDAFIFSFVRHPYERIWSCYKNKVSNPVSDKNIFACHGINFSDSFDTFVDKICEIPDSEADRHFRSQSWFLMNGNQRLIDFVGRLENMNEDWETLRQRFDLPDIPHHNSTSQALATLSDRNKKLLQNRYSNDFENFYPSQF